MTRRASLTRRAALISFLLTSLVSSASVRAQPEPLSFMVTPMTVETSAVPGTEQTGAIAISNPGAADGSGEPLRLRVYAADWTLDRDGTPQTFKPETARPGARPDSCSEWLQINPVELEVPPGETRQVRYTFHVPAKADGTYHTMLLFEKAPEPMQPGGRGMVITGRIACALYVQVGPQVRRVRITGFHVAPDGTLLTLENTGNSHVRLKGVLQFADAQGKVVAREPIPSSVVLPGLDSVRDLRLPTPRLSGAYTATALLDYGGDVLAGVRTHVQLP